MKDETMETKLEGLHADILTEQAEALERLLPELHRNLFALEPGQPLTELPISQLRMFVLLRDGPLPLSTIAERLGVSPSTVTQVADRLEAARLVKRVAGADDRRVKRLQLTAKGATLFQARRERRVARVRHALDRLPESCREEVLSAFRMLVDASADEKPMPAFADPTGERAQV